MTRVFIILLLLLLSIGLKSVSAQYYESRIDSLVDELFENDNDIYDLLDGNINFHFLYLNTNYSNKTLFAGREIGDNMYNLSGQVYYFISNGLYFGASGAWYSQMDPGYRVTALTGGFSNGIKKWNTRYRLSYVRYVYSIENYDPIYSNAVNTGLTYKFKKFGARADYTLLFGQDYNSQISADLYAKIPLIKLDNYDKIQFEPEVSFYFGSEEVETDIGVGDPTNPFYRPEYIQQEVFGMMNIEFQFPLSIDYKDFMLEFEYSYNLPRSLDPEYEYPNSHFLTISLGYIISFN